MSAISGWETRSFSDLIKLIRNGYAGQQVADATDFPVSRIETIADARIDFQKVGYVRSIPLSYLLHEGDMLFSNINSVKHIGKIAQVKRGTRLYHGMNLLVMRLIDEVDENFIFYKLNSKKIWFEQMSAQAVNQASINQATIKELELEIPTSKPEQTKIAEILSTVDRAIEQTEALIAKQQRLKTGLMQDLLTRGIDENGNLRSEQTHPFKDSPLGRIPVEWEVKPIESKLECIIDYRGRTPVKTDAGIPLITAKNVREGFLCEEPREFIDTDAYDSWMTRGIPEPGDVMITTEAPMGNVARVPDYKIALAQRLITLPTKKNELSSDFLFWMLHWSRTLERLELLTSGSTVVGIKQSVFRRVEFSFPPLDEQSKIAALLNAERDTAETNLKHLSKLRALKTALMQDLLTGRKRVTDLLDGKERVA